MGATLNMDGLERVRALAVNAQVKAGVLEGATNHETHELIAPYAAANEFGVPGRIPSRPFLRATLDAKQASWVSGVERLVAKGWSVRQVLNEVGKRMKDDIVATIESDMPPPNSPATIALKMKKVTGGAKGETMAPGTLISTPAMVNSINFEIAKG